MQPPQIFKLYKFTQMKFIDTTVKEFNKEFGTSIKDYSTFYDFIKSIEYQGYSIFYIDSGPDDVIQAIEDEQRDPEVLILRHVLPIDIYIAIEKDNF